MAPPVLLLHGLATSPERTWRESGLMDLLADAGREVIAPTLPAHGAGASHDSAEYESLLDQVLASFPDAACDVVGFSLGGQLALRAALAEPEDRAAQQCVIDVFTKRAEGEISLMGRGLLSHAARRAEKAIAALNGE